MSEWEMSVFCRMPNTTSNEHQEGTSGLKAYIGPRVATVRRKQY